MQSRLDVLTEIIKSRRTIKPQAMNGKLIEEDSIKRILSLADYAPTHGLTEPWRFVVFGGDQRISFCHEHAAMYLQNTPENKFEKQKFEKLYHMGDKASHVVVAIMKRGDLPKIPEWEEKAATAAAIQNILLAATATGMASYWGSGGMAQHPAMKKYFDLLNDDRVMGILYFGYADKLPVFSRNIPFDEKIKWM